MSAKYCEVKYPVVEDVCHLMKCPFSFDEFIEMESIVYQIFEYNLQFPNMVEVTQSILA